MKSRDREEMDRQPAKIVSLLPSATEIVYALGLGDRLVGRSHECDFPPGVERLPVLTHARVSTSRPTAEIDRSVREMVRAGLSIYRVDDEALAELRPELVVTQDQCEVCAVSLDEVEAACRQIGLDEALVCSLHPECLADVVADFRRVAAAAGVSDRGEALVARFESGLAEVTRAVEGRARPKVACIEWLEPPMVAGGWMPELVLRAGGTPVIVTEPKRFAQVGWDEIERADADVTVILPCGYGIDRALRDLEGETGERVAALRSTAEGRTWVVDGNAYFNRPGPRLVESARILACVFHPEVAMEAPPGSFARWLGAR